MTVDRDILEAARDAFNDRYKVGDKLLVKQSPPHTKAKRPAPKKRAVSKPAFIDGDAVWVAFEPAPGQPDAWPLKSLKWNA